MKPYIIWICSFLSMVAFWSINTWNYQTWSEAKQTLIQHPEHLPNAQTAEGISFGFKNIIADIYWIDTIQYIGWNIVGAEYKKYLFAMMDLITELNPYFEPPYIIGQLLLPNSNTVQIDSDDAELHTQQAIQLGLKWVKNFCDPIKIQNIIAEDNLQYIWTKPEYINPCQSYKIPFYLAFIYYYYDNNPEQAGIYYKIASANSDSVEWAKILAAIMQWKSGNREKSILMFLNIAKFIEPEDTICQEFAQKIENITAGVFLWWQPLNGTLISALEQSREQVFPVSSEQPDSFSDTKCSSYVQKAIREFNMAYIESANEAFMRDHDNLPSRHAKWLFESGYIDFLPTDHQQNENYGIIYAYDYEKWRYEYSVGNYD